MRILLTTQPAYGHFRPMLPLADVLRARGHEIRVASAARFARVIEDHGFEAEIAGLDWLEGDHASIPEELRAPPGLGLPQFFAHQFVWMTAERLARDVVALTDRWRPDVVIHETTEFGGALAAERIGVPSVGLQIASPSLITPEVTTEVERALLEVRNGLGLPHGGARPPLEDHPIVCFAPPSLHDPAVPLPRGLASFGPPRAPASDPLEWLDGFGSERPLVYATLGTVFSDPAFHLPFFPAVAEALAGDALDVVITVGPNGDPAALGEQPENVRVATYVPQRAVLDRCSAVVCHGGYGTLLDAIDAGVPLVVVPFGADQYINAESVQRLGLGRVIDEEHLTPDAVRQAVLSLLGDQRWRENVVRVRDEWRALPGPEAAGAVVEGAVERRRARPPR